MSEWQSRISRTALSAHPDVLLLNPVKGAPGTRGTEASVLKHYSDTVGPSYLFGRFSKTFPAEPLYFAMLAGTLRSRDISCEIADGYCHRFAVEEMFDIVRHFQPRIVAIAVFHNTLASAAACARRIKAWDPSVTVVIGSAYASPRWREIVSWPEIDYVVVGDGEVALADLAQAVLRGAPAHAIAGVAAVRDGEPRLSTPQPLADLDAIALPARDLLPLVLEDGYGVSAYSTRGCAFGRCTFCYLVPYQEVSLHPRWRARSAGNVVDEIEALVRDHGIRQVTFVDEDYFGDNKGGVARAVEIAKLLISRKIEVNYYINALVKSLVYVARAGYLPLLAESGLNTVFAGFESSSTSQLKEFLKPQRPEQYEMVIDTLNDNGIRINPGLITFSPAAGIDDVRANVKLAERMRYYDAFLFTRRLVDLAESPADTRSVSMEHDLPQPYWRDAYRLEHEQVCASFNDVRVGTLYQTMRILCSMLVELYQAEEWTARERLVSMRSQLISAHYRAFYGTLEEYRDMAAATPSFSHVATVAERWFTDIKSILDSTAPCRTDEEVVAWS